MAPSSQSSVPNHRSLFDGNDESSVLIFKKDSGADDGVPMHESLDLVVGSGNNQMQCALDNAAALQVGVQLLVGLREAVVDPCQLKE